MIGRRAGLALYATRMWVIAALLRLFLRQEERAIEREMARSPLRPSQLRILWAEREVTRERLIHAVTCLAIAREALTAGRHREPAE